MSSIVLDLQQDILKSDCDIVTALRKAHLIASQLSLKEFDAWVYAELNGYSYKMRDSDTIPEYRKVKGTLKALNPYHGWIPAQCPDDEVEALICERKLWQSVSELLELYEQCDKSGSVIFQFPAGQAELIEKAFDLPIPMMFALHISRHLLKEIIEQIKNCLLEWTLKLSEKGILGEGMQFNADEIEKASAVPQTVNNFYAPANIVNAPIDHSAVVAGNDNTVSFSYDAANDAVAEIETALRDENISLEDRESALEMLTDIRNKIDQQKKPGIIKALLVGLKDFLIGVGASATVAALQSEILGLF